MGEARRRRERPEADPPIAADAYDDFDAWYAEQEGEPLRIKVRGKIREFRHDLPAIISVRVARMQSADELDQDEILKIAEGAIGKETLDDLLDDGLGTVELLALMRYVTERMVKGAVAKATGNEPEGDVVPFGPEQPTASGATGPRSRRTSSGSTA